MLCLIPKYEKEDITSFQNLKSFYMEITRKIDLLTYHVTLGVVTRGLDPPMAPGKMDPVSW